jgi:hypothetical protein
MNKIFLGLILIIFWSCDRNAKQGMNSCGLFKIDTSSILQNKNLDNLISKLEKANLLTFTKTDSIPHFIKVFLDSCEKPVLRIANKGERWDATDQITGDFPMRQIIFGSIGQDIALLTYYKGGIGMSERILIFQLENSCITDFWCGGTLDDLTTKDQVVQYLKENKNKEWGLNTNIIHF